MRAESLRVATNALLERNPDLSAARTLTRPQRRALAAVLLALCAGAIADLTVTVISVMGFAIALYLAAIVFRLRLFRLSARGADVVRVAGDRALAVPDSALPSYTVLVPAFHEPNVVERLIESVGRLVYPDHLLDIKLLLEEDDVETVEAAFKSPGVDRFDVLLVPPGEPRTKPKALNFGLQFAHGEVLTVYDVEDRPDELQLRRAAVALQEGGPSLACVQAELGYYNPTQNIITKWFTVEYLMWFTQMLPGLSFLDAPVPLGGTSNHFRVGILRDAGGWDPFNVTEDADLGVRLHRLGYRTAILGSATLEEANSDFVNWIRQRSRWYKGYLQSWLVHMRHPSRLWRELGGFPGFFRFTLFVGGTPFIAVMNPVFWLMTVIWFVGRPAFILHVFPAPLYYLGLGCWLGGNFLFMYANVLVVVDNERPELLLPALLSPVYWVMMSIAAVKAAVQLVFTPSYWEKTHHGLDQPDLRTP